MDGSYFTWRFSENYGKYVTAKFRDTLRVILRGAKRQWIIQEYECRFGITYVLPLIIALVSAKEGDIILVENPEAHIHPAGQSMLGELIARAGARRAADCRDTYVIIF